MSSPEMTIAIFLIAAKYPTETFLEWSEKLAENGTITRDEIPKVLDKICKMKGNAGEIGREIRKELKSKGWKP